MFRTALLATMVLSVTGLPGVRAGSSPLFPGAKYATGNQPNFVAIGDLNSDQVPNPAVMNQGYHPAYEATVSVLLGEGHGQFAAAQQNARHRGPGSDRIGGEPIELTSSKDRCKGLGWRHLPLGMCGVWSTVAVMILQSGG
jgi:hypothetical protein